MLARSEFKWRLKCNMMNSEENEVCHQQMRSAWYGVQGGQGECWCWWGCAECNGREQSRAKEGPTGVEEHLTSGAAIHAEHLAMGRNDQGLEWNRGAPNRGRRGDWGAQNETLKRQSRLRCTYSSVGASFGRWGMKQPTMCNWWVVEWLLQ